MRPLTTPPPFPESQRLLKVLPLLNSPELKAFLTKANSDYYYWDDVRRRPLPLGLDPEDVWTALKFTRAARKELPLLDIKQRPFSYWVPEHAIQTIHYVDRHGGGTLAAEPDGPDLFEQIKERVLIDSLMDEAIATSQIEGAITTRLIAKDLLRSGRKPKDRSEQMIANGYRTIRLLRERATRPLSIEWLHEIQSSMTENTLDDPEHAGRFRDETDNVRVVDDRDGSIVFVPPPADQLPQRIDRMIDFANQPLDSEPFIHPLIRATVLHFWLAYEHPYVDGNGRTARALFYWSMLKAGYWLFEFLTISRIILMSPMQYYRSFLYSENDESDLTYFMMFQLDVTQKALLDLHDRLRKIHEQQRRMQSIRLAAKLNARQRALLDHALRHPSQIYTIESHQGSHGVSHETARNDLDSLEARGLLVEVGGQRPRQFSPSPDLARRLRLK